MFKENEQSNLLNCTQVNVTLILHKNKEILHIQLGKGHRVTVANEDGFI